MNKSIWLVALVATVLLLLMTNCATEPAKVEATEEEVTEEEVDEQYQYAHDLYKGNCTSCHAASVPQFIDRDWLNGNSWNEVNRAIRYGHIFMEDVDFVKTFPDSAFNKLTDYILVSLEQKTIESFAIDPDYSESCNQSN